MEKKKQNEPGVYYLWVGLFVEDVSIEKVCSDYFILGQSISLKWGEGTGTSFLLYSNLAFACSGVKQRLISVNGGSWINNTLDHETALVYNNKTAAMKFQMKYVFDSGLELFSEKLNAKWIGRRRCSLVRNK